MHGASRTGFVGDRFVSADSSLTKRAMDAITGWRVLGLRHREHILPVGALVTAVGELAASDGSAGGGGGGTSVAPACKGCVPCGNGRVLVLRVRLTCQVKWYSYKVQGPGSWVE